MSKPLQIRTVREPVSRQDAAGRSPFGPVFGTPTPDCPYVVRPSAYALVVRDGLLAVARTPKAVFLPGGGIEDGETAQAAVMREGIEECGLLLRPVALLGTAVQIAYSETEAACFEKRCTFFAAEVTGTAPQTEADHTLLWLSPEDAFNALSHGSHAWAVERFLERLVAAE